MKWSAVVKALRTYMVKSRADNAEENASFKHDNRRSHTSQCLMRGQRKNASFDLLTEPMALKVAPTVNGKHIGRVM